VGSHLQDDNTDPNTGQIWVLQDDRDFVVPLFENVTGPRRLQPFEAFGSMFHHAALRRNYSEQLIELVHRCLAVNPQDRPTARSILRLAKETVELFRNLSGPNNEPADFKDGGGSKVLNMVKAKLPGKLKKYAGHQFPQQPQSVCSPLHKTCSLEGSANTLAVGSDSSSSPCMEQPHHS